MVGNGLFLDEFACEHIVSHVVEMEKFAGKEVESLKRASFFVVGLFLSQLPQRLTRRPTTS